MTESGRFAPSEIYEWRCRSFSLGLAGGGGKRSDLKVTASVLRLSYGKTLKNKNGRVRLRLYRWLHVSRLIDPLEHK